MNLLQRFQEHINAQHLFSPKDKLLLAVSGGVDSVALCELCKQAGYDFLIAHCNFKLRGKESERDKEFVKALAAKYRVTFLVKDFDTEQYAEEHKMSVQEAARFLRYEWFRELVVSRESLDMSRESLVVSKGIPTSHSPNPTSHSPNPTSHSPNPTSHSPNPTHLLTAHHADDNNETLLMNFFRGTGLHGLTGIPAKNDHIRRPLLPFSKEELLAFAKENKLDWVEDSSNESSKYTRNYFRNELIPAVEKVFPQVRENLQDNLSRFKETEALYKLSVGAIKAKLVRRKGEELHIPVKQLLGYNNRALVYEVIAEFGFTEKQIEEVIKLGNSDSGSYINSPSAAYRIIKHRHWFIISPAQSTQSENIIIEQGIKEVRFSLGNLRVEETTNEKPKTTNQETLDLSFICYPLLLRKWKTGDYFYPLGMKKKKKIARFLIDLKLSKTDKEKVWVLESNKRIAWVLGHRIDERFKITEKTKQVLSLRLETL